VKRYLACGVLVAAMFASSSANAEELRLTTLYRTGTFTKGGGKVNVVMRDVVGDARPDIISCNYGGSAYALSYDGPSSSYRDRWISPNVGCTAVGAGDRNGDGLNKVFVAGSPTGVSQYGVNGPSYLFAFDATSYGPELAKVLVSTTEPVNSIAVGNVDGDAALEVVAITSTKFYVFNAATFALKWSGAYGGHTVAIGDLEGDGKNEIIIGATNDGHVLDAYTQTYKWGYFGGFGPSMTVGDVDNDGKAEIIGGTGIYNGAPSVKIINGDTMTTSTLPLRAEAVGVGDANNDGQNELIVGPDQWGDIEGYTVSGTKLWSVYNPSWGTLGIVVGDPDGDGKNEVVWAAHDSGLFVGNANTQTMESIPDDFDGPFRITVADLDGDGHLEMVVTSATANGSSYIGIGTAYVLDYETHRLIAKLPIPNYLSISQIAIGQVDGDAAKEIVLLAGDHSGGQILVYDGVTFALEWSSGTPPCCSNPSQPTGAALLVRDIDGDATDEIIYATNENRIQVLNGGGPFIQYTSPVLDGPVYNMDIADVDGDGILDLAVATKTGAYIFKTSDWSQRTYIPLASLNERTIAAAPGHFAVALSGDGIAMYSGTSLAQEWSCSSGNVTSDLAFANLGGQWRLTAAMSDGSLRIFPAAGSSCPAFDTVSQNVAYDAHNYSYTSDRVQLTFADLNGDGRPELLAGSSWEASISVLGFASEPRGDVDADGVVTDLDIDALAAYFYGNRATTPPAGDVNADGAIRPDDLFYLINYRRGTGAPPPASMPAPSGANH
jgi:hypothetical protein